MSDLQCPARILVARHGQAAYPQDDLMLDHGGWLTELGNQQASELATRVADEKVAAVYTSTLERARQTGAVVGAALGLPVTQIPGVQEFSVGDLAGRPEGDPEALGYFTAWLDGRLDVRWPGAETGEEVIARFVAAVEELADRHRGETVLVVSHGGVMSFAIPHTVTNADSGLSRRVMVPNCAMATVEVDSSGWRLMGEWPGTEYVPSGAGARDEPDPIDPAES